MKPAPGRPGSWPVSRLLHALLLTLLLPDCVVAADWPDLQFRAASVEYEGLVLDGVRSRLTEAGAFSVAFDRGHAPGQGLLDEVIADGLDITGELEELLREQGATSLSAVLSVLGLEGRLGVQLRPSEWRLMLGLVKQPVSALVALPGMPAAAGWLREGRVDASLEAWQFGGQSPELEYRVGVSELGFDSPEGRFAAQGLALTAAGSLGLSQVVSFDASGRLQDGELLVDAFYRDFSDGGLDYDLAGEWRDGSLALSHIGLDDGGALSAEASAQLDFAEAGEWDMEVARLELAFPAAYGRYIEPVAAAWTLDGLEVTGYLDWNGEWVSGDLVSGDLQVGDFSIVDTQRERFAVTGLEAHLRPGDHAFDSRLGWQGLLLGSINLGPGRAVLDSAPGSVALKEPLELEVLGGRVQLETLAVALPGGRADGAGEPDVALAASMERLDMARLTAALGWPEFGGTISGEIPGVSLDDGVLGVDGEIRFDVFDGRVTLQNVRIERAFGVLPSLAADIGVSDLDLEQLTSTFSFGQIAGRLDGWISDLRMLDWKPVAFDAWLGTPERQQGTRDISRQAVNRLTTIGGGAPTAALTGPLMRMFSSFAYRRLGLGCTLQDNVCHLRGLSDDGAGVLILEGAGVPKITIRAFNRDIDWPQMVANLVAISEGESIRVGDAPDGPGR